MRSLQIALIITLTAVVAAMNRPAWADNAYPAH